MLGVVVGVVVAGAVVAAGEVEVIVVVLDFVIIIMNVCA